MNASTIRELCASGRHDDALHLAKALALSNPTDAEIQFEAACVHDFLGAEREAVPYYRAALAGPLDADRRLQALVGLGSTYRTLGRYAEAQEVLLRAVSEFPAAHEAKVFLAMVRHNLGLHKAAVELLLGVIVETSGDAGVNGYRRAIEFYAQDVDKTWPGGEPDVA